MTTRYRLAQLWFEEQFNNYDAFEKDEHINVIRSALSIAAAVYNHNEVGRVILGRNPKLLGRKELIDELKKIRDGDD